MADIIKRFYQTAAAWTAANPTLADRQFGWESDTGRIKVGDGATAWTSLAYYSVVKKKTAATLSDVSWTLDTGLYKYTLSDADILAGSIVDIIPQNSTIDIVIAAEMLPAVDVTAGQVVIWCKNEPTANISINYNISNL